MFCCTNGKQTNANPLGGSFVSDTSLPPVFKVTDGTGKKGSKKVFPKDPSLPVKALASRDPGQPWLLLSYSPIAPSSLP